MKTKMTLGLIALALAAGTADADGIRGAGGLAGADFATLDRTGDGLLTAEDFAAASEARFDAIDADGDGQVSEEEFVAHARANAADRAAEMFSRLDADGDGLLSRDALEARAGRSGRGMERMLDRFDADGDGGLSAEEFETARAEMREGWRGRGGFGHGGHR